MIEKKKRDTNFAVGDAVLIVDKEAINNGRIGRIEKAVGAKRFIVAMPPDPKIDKLYSGGGGYYSDQMYHWDDSPEMETMRDAALEANAKRVLAHARTKALKSAAGKKNARGKSQGAAAMP